MTTTEHMPHPTDDAELRALRHRLARIEGQVRGVARMTEEDRPCVEILTQIAAAHAALEAVSAIVVERYLRDRLNAGRALPPDVAATVERLLTVRR